MPSPVLRAGRLSLKSTSGMLNTRLLYADATVRAKIWYMMEDLNFLSRVCVCGIAPT